MLNFLARPVFHLENMHVEHTGAWYYTVYSQINRRKRRLEYSRIKPCETKCHRDYSAKYCGYTFSYIGATSKLLISV